MTFANVGDQAGRKDRGNDHVMKEYQSRVYTKVMLFAGPAEYARALNAEMSFSASQVLATPLIILPFTYLSSKYLTHILIASISFTALNPHSALPT